MARHCRLPAANSATIATPEDLRRLVGGLDPATQVMEERSKALEGELQNSSQQVNELKSQLDNVRKEASPIR